MKNIKHDKDFCFLFFCMQTIFGNIFHVLLKICIDFDILFSSSTPLVIVYLQVIFSLPSLQPNTIVHLFYTSLSYATSASSLECMELLIKVQ